MANDWETVLTLIVRNLINDVAGTVYTDERVQTAIVVAGYMVALDLQLNYSYAFDFETPDITPDPVEINDSEAVALFGLKAACILSMNAYQSAVGKGIKVRDGDSEVDTTGTFRGYKDILEVGPCGAYTKLLKQITINKGFGVGKAVFSPIATGGYGPNGIWHIRGFYDSLAAW